MPAEPAPTIPLSGWADRQLAALAAVSGPAAIAKLSGAGLMGERAALNNFRIPGQVSAGGGCRLYPARGGWIALNLAREDDRALLPALFGEAARNLVGDTAIAANIAASASADLLAQGRALGLAIAGWDEAPTAEAITTLIHGPGRQPPAHKIPLVIDLSALWAGPLTAHLLWLAGAQVVKVESANRPDGLRPNGSNRGDPALYAALNQGKASVALDLRDAAGRDALLALIARADIVIEAARPRALRQLGIDADALARSHPGLVWLSITAHGARGAAADWVGFGDDCAVAGGLTAALHQACGTIGFAGDAPADPLTGIAAARAGWEAWAQGRGVRLGIAMSGVVAQALAEERARNPAALLRTLAAWAKAKGQPFPAPPPRPLTGSVQPLGFDNPQWLAC